MRLKLIQQTLYYKYMQARHLSNFGTSKYHDNLAAKNEKVNFQVGESIFVADRAKKAEVIATNLLEGHEELKYKTFRSWIDDRRKQARNSILIQVKSIKSVNDLKQYCNNNIGKVKSMHYHNNNKSDIFQHFYVVEFDDSTSVAKAMFEGAIFAGNSEAIPVSSPFMWFSSDNKSVNSKKNSIDMPFESPQFKNSESIASLNKYLSTFEGIDLQIQQYYDLVKLNDVSTRLRFIACEQIELALTGMFPHAEVIPFGSSVNSYGKYDCDIDMCLKFSKDKSSAVDQPRLTFHTKGTVHSHGSRLQTQRYCDQISQIIKDFLPGCQNVQNISHARVPIIKYCQELVGLECDLSFCMSGYHMSELLYMYGELDNRVRPLIFTIRLWAKEQGLVVDQRPTPYLTNFMLTLMAIFFLQNHYKILPPFNELRRLADSTKDSFICDDGVVCSYIRDISGLQPSLNTHWNMQPPNCGTNDYKMAIADGENNVVPLSLQKMLKDFFAFYSNFNYQKDCICIATGQSQSKTNSGIKKMEGQNSINLVIINPLQPELNVGSNVRDRIVHIFRKKCKSSLKRMQELEDNDLNGLFKSESVSALCYVVSEQSTEHIVRKKINSLNKMANVLGMGTNNTDLKDSFSTCDKNPDDLQVTEAQKDLENGLKWTPVDPIYSKEEPAQNPSIRTALNLQPNLFGNNELSDIVDEQHPKVFANGQKKATDDVINSSSNLATPAKISSKTLSDSDMEPHLPSNNKINLSGKHIKELLEDSKSNENRSKLPHKLNSISKRKRWKHKEKVAINTNLKTFFEK